MSIFLAFALGIVIPSGFLSYLGLRSYRYESALLRKELEERYQTVSQVMQRKVLEQLQSPLNALRALAGKDHFARWRLSEMNSELISIRQLDSNPIDFIALFDAQDRMLFPVKQDTHEPPPGSEPDWGANQAEVRRLENMEFAQHKSLEALKGYQALLRKPLAPPLRAALLLSVGAAAERIANKTVAESAYLSLIREDETLRDPSGWPLGLVGRRLLTRLYDSQGQKERSISTRLDIFDGLLMSRWGNFSGRDHELEETTKGLQREASASSNAPREMKARWAQLLQQQGRLTNLQAQTNAFLHSRWPSALKRLHSRGWTDQGGVLRLGDGPAGQWLVASPVMNRAGDRPSGLLVAIIEPGGPWSRIQETLTDMVRPVGLQWALGEQVPHRPAGWRTAIQKAIEGTEPPLMLTILEPSSSTQDRLSRKRLWIYGGMIGLSFLVIVIGLWMMSRAVRREIEIAELKSDFVANVSHELRTPLSAISYIAQMLNRGRYRSEADIKDFYGMLSEESSHLQELIEDILDFSKMLGGKAVYQKDPLDLAQAAQEATDRLRGKAEAGGFRLSLNRLPSASLILGDRRAVVQALSNLIDNAMKYSGASRLIEISVRPDKGDVIAEVLDHGIGIDPSEQDRIFEKFYRVEKGSARNVHGGVGLGLAMVQHIMHSHGGRIDVRSSPGQGSVFTLRFPELKSKGEIP